MSWLFSRALVEEYSVDICSDGEQSAPSSGPPTQQAYCSPDKMTALSRLSRFGMTFKPLTEDRGEALLMSYLAAFRARTSVQPEAAPASRESAAVCGSTWPASPVRYDPASSLWKTAHCLWEEDLPWSSVTLPPWGMTRNGYVYRHPTSERPINGTGSGLWRTPSAHVIDAKSSVVRLDGRKPSDPQVGLADQVMAAERGMWPTPTVCGNYNRAGLSAKSGDGLATAVAKWPTPTASQHKGWSKNHNRAGTDDRIDYTIEREAHEAGTPGRLNPTWVEWLMGWPLGWTDLKPLEMGRFREWRQQHLPSSLTFNDRPCGD